MIQVWTVVAAAFLLAGTAPIANAPASVPPSEGAVTSLSVVPRTGRAEVVISVRGSVDVQDFILANPNRVVIDVHGARLGAPARLYDKVSRGGITNIRMAQYMPDIVRVVLELDSPRDYSVVRGDGDVRVTVEGAGARFSAWHTTTEFAGSVVSASAPVSSGSRAASSARRGTQPEPAAQRSQQPRITVTYHEADIRDVIAAFAAFSGRTIVVGRDVQGTVTAEIRDQPWDVALQAILQSQGLAADEDQYAIIRVDSYRNIAGRASTEPLLTQIVKVNYARAGSMVETIRSLLSRDCGGGGTAERPTTGTCVTRGTIVADSGTNSLLITDVQSRLGEIVGYVRDLDVRTPQVAIKAKIILVNRTNIEDLGLSYDFGTQSQFFNRLVQRPDPSTFTPIDTDGDGIPDALGGGSPFDPNVNIIDLGGNQLSAIANANNRVPSPALQVVFSTAIGRFDLTAFLDALQEVQLADLQAEPSIVTLDNRPARILSGEETPIRVIDAGAQTGAGQQQQQAPRATVTFKETGIMLEVTPHITNNRQILMTLHAERSNLVPAASDLGFTFQKQVAQNQLLVADGETAVIGGLTVTQVTVSKSGIPILVDLPLIGRLFGRTFTQEEKRDLLVLVTPHIVEEGEVVGSARR